MVELFIIAEAGVNHNGRLDTAKRLVDAAREAGADAVKFQAWKTSEIIERGTETAAYQLSSTGNSDQYSMLQELEVSLDFLKNVYNYCEKSGIEFMCTADDAQSLLEIDSLLLRYKVGSGDLDNYLLLKELSKKKKPIILSTGMSTKDRVSNAVDYLISNGYNESKISLLQCTSSYPAVDNELNLAVIETYKTSFPRIHSVGFSDHSIGIEPALVALGAGARIFEKHITLDKQMKGPDHQASLSPEEFNEYVAKLSLGAVSLGSAIKTVTDSEKQNKEVIQKFLFAKQDLKIGSKISMQDVQLLRSNRGQIKASQLQDIIGTTVTNLIKKGEPINKMDINV